MVRLLGPQDRLLTTIEHQYPGRRRCMVRGNRDRPRAATPSRSRRGDAGWSRSSSSWCATAPDLGPDRSDELGAHARARTRGQPGRGARARRSSPAAARASGRRPLGQKAYVDAIDENTIVFGIGPAGTGKTYLAMAKAVQALQRKEVEPHHPDAARRSRRASGSGSCPARSPTRSTRTCGRSTTRSTR